MARTVLVVDDEPHIRYMLEFKLSRAGFTVITATGGKEAFELARQHRPDAMVTDFQMPGGNGLELCERLKQTPETAGIPALMLTARGYKVPPSDLARTNIVGLIPKPFSPSELIAQLQEAMKSTASPEADGDAEPGATAA